MAKLFIIPTPIAADLSSNVLLPFQLAQITHLRHFVVETAKVGRLHLKQLNLTAKLQDLSIIELNKHNQDLASLILPFEQGFDIGLISDCGMPAVADPGAILVAYAHRLGVDVIPLVGPSSLLLALMASGVNGQAFAFVGYLPIDPQKRICKIKELEQIVVKHLQSQIIIEAPFRNQQLLNSLIANLHKDITLSVAINLMQSNQQIISQSVSSWQQRTSLPDLHKQEVVFVIGVL